MLEDFSSEICFDHEYSPFVGNFSNKMLMRFLLEYHMIAGQKCFTRLSKTKQPGTGLIRIIPITTRQEEVAGKITIWTLQG